MQDKGTVQVFSKYIDVTRKLKWKFEFPEKSIIRFRPLIRSIFERYAEEKGLTCYPRKFFF